MRVKGFTLLDLMIAIAIIGILASISIPAFAVYNARSKTVEARINLDLIGKGAVAFFAEEHSYDKGLKVRSREYPSAGNSRDTNMKNVKGNTSVQPIGGMPYQSYNQKSATDGATKDSSMWNDGNSQRGQKHNPADFEYQFSHYPWLDLQFRINSPFYYSYNYEGKVDKNKSYFASTASACLLTFCVQSGKRTDDKGKVIPSDCDSGYVIVGGPHGTVSTVIDNSDFKIEPLCGKSELSRIKPNLSAKGVDIMTF